MKILWHWIVLSIAVFATTYIFKGKIIINPWYVVLVVAAVLMFINLTIKPILSLLTLPITIITLGLFSLILNGFIFWTLSAVIPGFSVATFETAIFGALIVSVLNWILEKIF